jgi:hypothetical protein
MTLSIAVIHDKAQDTYREVIEFPMSNSKTSTLEVPVPMESAASAWRPRPKLFSMLEQCLAFEGISMSAVSENPVSTI